MKQMQKAQVNALLNNNIRKGIIHIILHGLVGEHFTAGLPSYPVGQEHMGL
jgi:hypothetical protein